MNSWLLKNLSMNDRLDVEFHIAVASQVLLCPRSHMSMRVGRKAKSTNPIILWEWRFRFPPERSRFKEICPAKTWKMENFPEPRKTIKFLVSYLHVNDGF